MCTFSPNLDCDLNSVRGLEFCKLLIDKFAFHTFDKVGRSNILIF